MHTPQFLQRAGSITAFLFTMDIAPKLHASSHFPHPVHFSLSIFGITVVGAGLKGAQ